MTVHAQRKAQKRPERTFSLHIRLILNPHNNQKQKQKITSPGKEDLISSVTSLLVSNDQFKKKNDKAYKETGKYGPFKGKNNINSP